MQPDFAAENSSMMMDLAKKYGVTPGTIDYVALGSRRVVKVPPPPVPTAGAKLQGWRRVDPGSLEAELLDTVHRHHLQALAMMDREMVSRHVRGMVLAGYAYGLYDPVCNIVANCLWYDSVFPASSSPEVQPKLLSCKAIFRLASRSLDALVAFMTAYAPSLSAEEAMLYLSRSHGNLHHAAVLVDREGLCNTKSIKDAFKAAILAAHLPNHAARLAQFWFIVNCAPTDDFLARHGIYGHPLAFGLSDLRRSQSNASILVLDFLKSNVGRLACLQPTTPSSSCLSRGAYRALRLKMHGYKMYQELCLNIVKVALEKLSTQFGEPYQINLLCGKNLLTPLPSGCYYHVNFLASREGEPTQLFFAEVRASRKGVDDVTLCCPMTLSGRTGGCFACEFMGMKLIHPVDEEFNGQHDHIKDRDPKMVDLFRKDPTSGCNVPLIDDYIFFEHAQHPDVTTYLETNYSNLSDDQIDLSFLWFENYLP